MNIRKEPALFVVALALAGWIWSGVGTVNLRGVTSTQPAAKPLDPTVSPVVVLAHEAASANVERDLFREPTEATPLPPRDLPFPALAPLPVVAPPLPVGQDAGAWHQLRMPGGAPTPYTFKESAPADGGGGDAGMPDVVTQGGSIPDEVLIKQFDRVWLATTSPFFGRIIHQDKYSLPKTPPFPEGIVFEQVARSSGKVMSQRSLPADEIQRIELADSLENKIEITKRSLGAGPASVGPREQFLRFLIQEARERDWVWKEADEQAKQLFAIMPNELGYRARLRVIRAKGDLAAELDLYRGASEEVAALPARWREQGRFEAQLGLLADAEEHLKKALSMAPNDPRNNAAYAAFLLARGRASEAVGPAELGARNVAQIEDEDQKFEVHSTVVAALLAVGRTDDAVPASSRASGGTSAQRAYLRGAVHYARGELDQAVEQFDRAAEELGTLDAVFALGACKLRMGRFDDARQLLERVRDEAPALRGRALAALGLLYERTAHAVESRSALEDAERTAPRDAYVLYLLGRRLRLDGEFDASISVLRRALSERDEFAEALAETSMALLQRAESADNEVPELLARTVRYADRLVEVDRGHYVPFLELQGYVLAQVGEVAQARRAFQAAAADGSAFGEVGLALLDYRQKRTADARTKLAQIANEAGRAPEVRAYAKDSVDLIDDHASKEQVRDNFAREDVGALWKPIGSLRPTIREEALVFRGNTGRVGEESFLRRSVKAGDLISVSVQFDMVGEAATTGFAGLRVQRIAGGDFAIEYGVRSYGVRKQVELKVVDAQRASNEPNDPLVLEVGFEVGTAATLGFDLVPDDDPNSRRLTLQVTWNGRVVHSQVLKQIQERAQFELGTDLVVQGSPVHVAFDDYRLVRRKESR